MEEYTFRLSIDYFKDLGQLDKSVSEHFSNWRSCARWAFAKCTCKLTSGSAWSISCLWSNCQVNNIYLILHQVEDLPLEWVLELC
jgi:hypothetical protein